MGDMGEVFTSWKKQKNKKKAENNEYSTNLLTKENISFESKNGGNYLIVAGVNSIIDFWPSTGKFIVRGGINGRGVRKVINIAKGHQ